MSGSTLYGMTSVGGTSGDGVVFALSLTNSSANWPTAYKMTFDNPKDVQLLRQFRDELQKRDTSAAEQVAWLYARSDAALALVLKSAELRKLAGGILNNHRDAIEKWLMDQPAAIEDPADIIAFCELVSREDKGEIGMMAENIGNMILAGMKTGDPVFGFQFGKH